MLKNIIKTIAVFFFIYCIAIFAEFHYWRNADSYPTWLSKNLDTPFNSLYLENITPTVDYFDKVCGKNRGLMAIEKKTNGFFMRCDDSLTLTAWLDGVYKINPESGVK